MAPTRRGFLRAAATAPAWSLPETAPRHDWTHRRADLVYPPREGDDVLVARVEAGAESGVPRTVAIDASTGRVRWTQPGLIDWRAPSVGDYVIVQREDVVTGVVTATGEVAWTASFAQERVANVLQQVVVGPENDVAYATVANDVVALDVASGERRWTRENVRGRIRGRTSDAVVFVADGDVVVADARTGETRWRRDVADFYGVYGDRILAEWDGAIVAFAETGGVGWRYDRGASVVGVGGEYVVLRETDAVRGTEDALVATGDREETGETLVALDDAGAVAWRFRLPTDSITELTEDALLAFTAGDPGARELAVVPLDEGRITWTDEVRYRYGLVSSSPGELRIPTEWGVTARSITDGYEPWRYETPSRGVYAVEREDRVYIGAETGTGFALHAVDPPWGGVAAATYWLRRHGDALAALVGFGGIAAAAAGVERWGRARRVRGHVETVERTDAWTTARVENGHVRTEYRLDDERDAFRDACETWAAAEGERGVLALHEWGTTPRPWVETAPYAATLRDVEGRERGLRAVSRAADAVAGLDDPHGLLRPESVVFDDDPKVRDVGLGSLAATAWPDRADPFAPPEGDRSNRGDVYRLGALARYVLTGAPPGDATDRRGGLERLSDDLADVVATALATDPGERYATPRRFGEYLSWAAFAQETW